MGKEKKARGGLRRTHVIGVTKGGVDRKTSVADKKANSFHCLASAFRKGIVVEEANNSEYVHQPYTWYQHLFEARDNSSTSLDYLPDYKLTGPSVFRVEEELRLRTWKHLKDLMKTEEGLHTFYEKQRKKKDPQTCSLHASPGQFFESIDYENQRLMLHLRNYANVVAWSQVGHNCQNAEQAKSVSDEGERQPHGNTGPRSLDNMFSLEALLAVSCIVEEFMLEAAGAYAPGHLEPQPYTSEQDLGAVQLAEPLNIPEAEQPAQEPVPYIQYVTYEQFAAVEQAAEQQQEGEEQRAPTESATRQEDQQQGTPTQPGIGSGHHELHQERAPGKEQTGTVTVKGGPQEQATPSKLPKGGQRQLRSTPTRHKPGSKRKELHQAQAPDKERTATGTVEGGPPEQATPSKLRRGGKRKELHQAQTPDKERAGRVKGGHKGSPQVTPVKQRIERKLRLSEISAGRETS